MLALRSCARPGSWSRRAARVCLVAASALLTACGTTQSMRGRPAYAVINDAEAPVPPLRMGSPAVIDRIVAEGTRDTQVMALLTELCTTCGPRLTGSSNAELANNWARDKFLAFGLDSAELHQWGTIATRFDRGPSAVEAVRRKRDTERPVDDGPGADRNNPLTRNTGTADTTGTAASTGNAEAPADEYDVLHELEFTTLAWIRGTSGPVVGKVVRMPETLAQADAMAADLNGAIVLMPASNPARLGVRGAGNLTRNRTVLREKIRRGEWPEPTHDAAGDAPAATADAAPATDEIQKRIDEEKAALAAGQPESFVGTFTYQGSPIPAKLTLNRDASGTLTGGTFAIDGFHEGPFDIAEQDAAAGTFTIAWRNPTGNTKATLTRAGDALEGASESGNPIKLALKDENADPASEPDITIPDNPEEVMARVLSHNPAGFVSSSPDELARTTAATGWRENTIDKVPQDWELTVRRSDYDYLNSRLADGEEVLLRVNLDHRLTEGPVPVYNTIAEIRGTEKPDEVVIVSAHMDSWNGPGSVGTVDNGTGTAVTLEAARILAAAGVRPKRTIRFCLWTGEEQGLLGSRGYVRTLSDEQLAKISCALNDDGGTNTQGGLPASSAMVPFMAAATAATNGLFYSETDGRYLNVNIRDTGERQNTHGGSDHYAFIEKGIPGFFWDEVGRADYRYAWHTQHDQLDQAIEEYLVQSAVNTAITAYNIANAETLVPRDPPRGESRSD